MSDSAFTGNSATVHGGGIDNFRTAKVTGSTFTGNAAGSGNGGLNNEPGGLLTQFDNQSATTCHPTFSPDGGSGGNILIQGWGNRVRTGGSITAPGPVRRRDVGPRC